MKKNYDILIEKYKEIKELGFIKADNNHFNAFGPTLERLLGSTSGDFNIPDFYDIEIKAIKNQENSKITLFSSTPDGIYPAAVNWLSNKYGYPDKDYKNIKVFKGNVYGNKFEKIGLFNSYKLKVDYNNKRIILQILDYHDHLVNADIYWDFDRLEEMVMRKIENIAIFKVDIVNIKNIRYYSYQNMDIYYIKGFELFLKLIELGKVYLTINTGVHKSGLYKGKFVNHGCAWRIKLIDIDLLYEKVY